MHRYTFGCSLFFGIDGHSNVLFGSLSSGHTLRNKKNLSNALQCLGLFHFCVFCRPI